MITAHEETSIGQQFFLVCWAYSLKHVSGLQHVQPHLRRGHAHHQFSLDLEVQQYPFYVETLAGKRLAILFCWVQV